MYPLKKVKEIAPRSLDEFFRMIPSKFFDKLVIRFLKIRKLQLVEVSSVAVAWIRPPPTIATEDVVFRLGAWEVILLRNSNANKSKSSADTGTPSSA